MTKRYLLIALACVLVIVTLPLFATISGLSLMAFDAGFAWQPALFSGLIIGCSILIPLFSLIFSIKLIRKEKPWHGLAVSLIPMLTLGVFWIWISQQSFS